MKKILAFLLVAVAMASMQLSAFSIGGYVDGIKEGFKDKPYYKALDKVF